MAQAQARPVPLPRTHTALPSVTLPSTQPLAKRSRSRFIKVRGQEAAVGALIQDRCIMYEPRGSTEGQSNSAST